MPGDGVDPGDGSRAESTDRRPRRRSDSSCDRRVADGRCGGAGQRSRARGAHARRPRSPARRPRRSRELAGVRLLQRRWPEVTDARDGGGRGRPGDALRVEAAGDEPVRPERSCAARWRPGTASASRASISFASTASRRTRHRVVERLIGVDARRSADARPRSRARGGGCSSCRRPSSARLEFVPVAVGPRRTARRRERARRVAGLAGLAFAAHRPGGGRHARAARHVSASLIGGGERIAAAWRFWPRPAARGRRARARRHRGADSGAWTPTSERQPFDAPAMPARRADDGAGRTLANWATRRLRWDARRRPRASRADIGRSRPGRRRADAGIGRPIACRRASDGDARGSASGRSRTGQLAVARTIAQPTAGASSCSRSASVSGCRAGRPRSTLWAAGDTGHARADAAARAPGPRRRPAAGRAAGTGRSPTASAEAQRWWRSPARSGSARRSSSTRRGRRPRPGPASRASTWTPASARASRSLAFLVSSASTSAKDCATARPPLSLTYSPDIRLHRSELSCARVAPSKSTFPGVPMVRCATVVVCLLRALLLARAPAEAQYFGRNKVHYDRLDFRVLQTEHFDIYYYAEEEEATRHAARMAERWYTRFSTLLDHTFTAAAAARALRQPSALRADQHHARRAGRGHRRTDRAHQVAHRDAVRGRARRDRSRARPRDRARVPDRHRASGSKQNAFALPGWFIEGMAEYLSLGPDNDAHR